jgi:hypothetical protein
MLNEGGEGACGVFARAVYGTNGYRKSMEYFSDGIRKEMEKCDLFGGLIVTNS